MGQTLPNGIYLPAEGERNCYDGLEGNWRSLDGLISTVGGKASASHSHGNITNDGKVGTTANKPLITGTGGAVQAGSFGNAANTFCEGNDSRLSDARTPVAHTHTKSDVTDLFNSDNTWSGSNSFNSGLTINNAASLNAVLQNAIKGNVSTTGDFAIFIKDKVNGNAATSLLTVYRGGQDSGGSYAQINIDTKGNDNNRYNNSILLRINPADNSNNAVLIPQRDKTIDLGTSTNKWKSLNGVNPGALSLPDISDADPISTNNWVGDNSSSNQYTPTENGWIYFRIEGANKNITIRYGGAGGDAPSITSESTISHLSVFFPVRSGVTMYIFFNGTMVKAFFYPCLGNV